MLRFVRAIRSAASTLCLVPTMVAAQQFPTRTLGRLEVDPLTCPACGGAMRILAFITEGAVVDQILAHLRRTRGDARVADRIEVAG